ncbi:excalibur calcium-binding domain-containing protein [Corynebacterium hylobatis]|uniref:Excalibur calcium-binding domain-containing protein n=1 Tax=Corynebacterium hylobatis TaxID=1859290 RepID=A0A3S0C0C4_9CORY|nr:excalibur calcium-binding domain-containing protein [Corynebacterium hylobatis]RSZ62088.1 excalibur calcium-binding domain-containing protein [Corynebacterium hylobatis]
MRTRLSLLLLLSPLVLAACGTSAAETAPVTVTRTTTATTTATATVTATPEVTTVTETVTDTATITAQAAAPSPEQANTAPMGFVAAPEPAPAPASTYYKNCAAARAAGAAPVYRGSPGYGTHLDRDGDGIGCE